MREKFTILMKIPQKRESFGGCYSQMFRYHWPKYWLRRF
jgi:hypothetical protein